MPIGIDTLDFKYLEQFHIAAAKQIFANRLNYFQSLFFTSKNDRFTERA